MLDSLKSLFENSALSEEVRSELEEAWNAKVEENKLQATQNYVKNLLRNMHMIKQQWWKPLML